MDVKICFLHRNSISFLAGKAKIPNFAVAFLSAGPSMKVAKADIN